MSLVISEIQNAIATISFNRPEAMNAFTPESLSELIAAIKQANSDKTVKMIVLQGRGRAFSAGVDLKLLQGISPHAGRIGNVFNETAYEAASTLRNSPMPIIAKVHGACFTGALELALHCDFILTTNDTKFGDTHAKFALRPTWGMSQNLARAVGIRRARELTFTARTFSGEQAAEWGLANEATKDQEALDQLVASRAAEIVACSAGALSAAKKLYRLHEENRPLEEALTEEVRQEFPEITDTAKRLSGFGS